MANCCKKSQRQQTKPKTKTTIHSNCHRAIEKLNFVAIKNSWNEQKRGTSQITKKQKQKCRQDVNHMNFLTVSAEINAHTINKTSFKE